jgi:hypothetical protein
VTLDPKSAARLQFLLRVVGKECRHLATTDQRLFQAPFMPDDAPRLETDPDLAERVEAFVGRFGRLQDTVGDKLLPALLAALGEPVGAAVDNPRPGRAPWSGRFGRRLVGHARTA